MKMNRLGARRFALGAAALVVATFGLASCGSDDSSDPSSHIRALLNAQPTTLDPVVGARSGQPVWGTMLEPLINTDSNFDPDKTGIVTDWKRDDPTTWTFTIRPGISFSNGEAADAAAVANSILLNRDTEAGILKSYFGNVASVEAPDATTVVLKTTTPQYNIPNLLTNVFLLPPKYYKEKGSEGFATAPVGTGPYVVDKVQPGRSFSVKVNPDYWGEKPKNTGIDFTWSSEPAQRLALLQSKSVDVAFDLTYTQAEDAEKAGLDVTSTETAVKLIAFMYAPAAPFDDPKLREAAALAIDRNAIVKGIFDGNAKADGGLLNVVPGTEPSQVVEPDPAKAKALVGGNGPTIPITYPAGQYLNIEEVAQAVGGYLEEAGFKVKYNPLDYGNLVKQVVGRQLTGMYIFAGVPNVAVPDFFASGFMKTVSITGNCPDPKADALAEEALEKDDAADAAPVYDELNTLGVVENHCYVPLYRQIFNYATQKNVSGVEYDSLGAYDFTKATH